MQAEGSNNSSRADLTITVKVLSKLNFDIYLLPFIYQCSVVLELKLKLAVLL